MKFLTDKEAWTLENSKVSIQHYADFRTPSTKKGWLKVLAATADFIADCQGVVENIDISYGLVEIEWSRKATEEDKKFFEEAQVTEEAKHLKYIKTEAHRLGLL